MYASFGPGQIYFTVFRDLIVHVNTDKDMGFCCTANAHLENSEIVEPTTMVACNTQGN